MVLNKDGSVHVQTINSNNDSSASGESVESSEDSSEGDVVPIGLRPEFLRPAPSRRLGPRMKTTARKKVIPAKAIHFQHGPMVPGKRRFGEENHDFVDLRGASEESGDPARSPKRIRMGDSSEEDPSEADPSDDFPVAAAGQPRESP